MRRPWLLALAVAAPLTALYLALAPPAADLAAATYRSDLFARAGFTTRDTGWYAAHGHWLPGYSLLSPALGALLGVRLLLALSALAASVLFALIAMHALGAPRVKGNAPTGEPPGDRSARPDGRIGGPAAAAAAVVFAFGVCVGMLSGRVAFDLGLAIGLAAVLALLHGRAAPALVLAVLCSVASPVAGAFLALAGVAGVCAGWPTQVGATRAYARARVPGVFTDDNARLAAALALAALVPVGVLSVAFPEGGHEPFAASAFWPALAGVLLFVLLLPRDPLTARAHLTLRVGAGLYALALIGAYLLPTPMGGNAARLGPLLAAPLLAGGLWNGRRTALAVLAPVLLYWQIVTPVRDLASIASDPSVHASYYGPLLAELKAIDRGRPTIVEVPLTRAHWEAAYLAGHDRVSLARGWERQLDTRYASLFYRSALTASAYRTWLSRNRVQYVALPDSPLDRAGRLEGKLVAHGAPYLRPIWHSRHWKLYRFIG
jgi:hypothetical protein